MRRQCGRGSKRKRSIRCGDRRYIVFPIGDRRDRRRFAEAYADPESGITTGPRPRHWPVCTGPVTYIGQEAMQSDIAHFKAALAAVGIEEGFMTAVAPGSAARVSNAYYATEEEFIFACAEALREEYRAIIDAGLILQLDDPSIAENWDQINPEPSVVDYQTFSMIRVEAINHAISGLPKDRIRFHLCWGSWHGPHTTDIPMRDIVNVIASTDCGLGGRVHPQIAWAKLESLARGAELATQQLWR